MKSFSRSTSRNERPGGVAPPDLSDLLLQQRTGALVQRRKGFAGGNGGDELVIVPRTFGFRRLLDFEKIGRMDLAAVRLDAAFAEQRVVGRHFLHLGDD